MFRRLEAPGALDIVPFAHNKVKMLEIAIEKNCPIINTRLAKLTEKFPYVASKNRKTLVEPEHRCASGGMQQAWARSSAWKV